MKKIFPIALAISAIFFFNACKDKGDNNPDNPNNQGVGNYLPTAVGNWWLYRASDGTIFRRYYTGRDTMVDNFNYNLFEQIDTNSGTILKEYYARFEGNYYTLLKIDNSGNSLVKAIVLNGDPKVGDNWTNTGSFTYGGINIPVKIEGSVTSISGVDTINGNVITDIIEVSSILYGKLLPTHYTNCGTIKMRFKKELGIIGEEYNIDVSGFFSKYYSNELINYHLQ